LPTRDRRSRRFDLASRTNRLPDRHSLKTFVCILALYARDVHTGELPGDPWHYEPAHGERYAREALIPTREFTALRNHCDRELAARFRGRRGSSGGRGRAGRNPLSLAARGATYRSSATRHSKAPP